MVNCGPVKVSLTVVGSTTSADARYSGLEVSFEKDQTTSSAVNGLPSFHVTPSRIFTVSSVPSSLNSKDSPSIGVGASALALL
ncbi:hypothetical protein D3C74_311300 [compost metagenome]